ncbi:hypothetical protein [Leisingera sp. ANG-Vp]|uniref:hypothetical protein n=1 Tax=Leisingera sp. ANG-Vp TaxID=1577896 RepID=UPI00187BC4BD|nr:hypothetical protein [Leisingera sp. ANG-Vp]
MKQTLDRRAAKQSMPTAAPMELNWKPSFMNPGRWRPTAAPAPALRRTMPCFPVWKALMLRVKQLPQKRH